MKLSIITINLNNSPGLCRTIESVIKQTFSDYEYVVIDGGSTDGSLEVLKEYSKRITYWISESDSGIYDAMNKGINYSTGEFVCFLNSGDLYVSKYSIEIMMNEIHSSKAEIFFGNLLLFETNSKKINLINIAPIHDKSDLLKNFLAHPSTFYRRRLFNEVGLFNINYRIASDVDWYLNALIKHKSSFSQINYSPSVFFNDGISVSNKKSLITEYKEVVSKYFTKFELRFFSGRTFKWLKGNVLTKGLIVLIFRLKLNRI